MCARTCVYVSIHIRVHVSSLRDMGCKHGGCKRLDDSKVLIENICQQSRYGSLHSDIRSKVWSRKYSECEEEYGNCTHLLFSPFARQPGPGTPQYSFLLLPYVVNLNIYYYIYLFQDKEMYFVRYL